MMKKTIALALASVLAFAGLALALPLAARGAYTPKFYGTSELFILHDNNNDEDVSKPRLIGMKFHSDDVFRTDYWNTGSVDPHDSWHIYFIVLDANGVELGTSEVIWSPAMTLKASIANISGLPSPLPEMWAVVASKHELLGITITIVPLYAITYTDPYNTAHGNPTSYTTVSTPTTLTPLANRPDATFLGWFDASGKQVTAIPAGSVGDINLVAKWKAVYTLSATAGPGGSITPASARVEEGGSQAFALTPSAGYTLDTLTVNGAAQTLAPGAASFTLADIRQNSTLHATFAPVSTGTPPEEEPPNVTAIRLAQKTLTLAKGKTTTIGAVADTAEGPAALAWSSSKPGVIKVVNTATGKIKALKTGKATLTATAQNGRKATVSIRVVNAKNAIQLTGASIAGKSSITMKVGKTKTLKATPAPKNATGAVIRWSSNNKKVASVDAAGRVTAHKKGTAKITVKIGSKKATVTIRVAAKTSK